MYSTALGAGMFLSSRLDQALHHTRGDPARRPARMSHRSMTAWTRSRSAVSSSMTRPVMVLDDGQVPVTKRFVAAGQGPECSFAAFTHACKSKIRRAATSRSDRSTWPVIASDSSLRTSASRSRVATRVCTRDMIAR